MAGVDVDDDPDDASLVAADARRVVPRLLLPPPRVPVVVVVRRLEEISNSCKDLIMLLLLLLLLDVDDDNDGILVVQPETTGEACSSRSSKGQRSEKNRWVGVVVVRFITAARTDRSTTPRASVVSSAFLFHSLSLCSCPQQASKRPSRVA